MPDTTEAEAPAGPSDNEALDEQLRPRQRRKAAARASKVGEVNASLVRSRYEAGVKAQRREIREYWLNSAFIENEQWVWWNNYHNRVDPLPRDEDRVQVTVNRMWPTTRGIVAKLTSRDLRFEVPPTAADDAKVRGAHIGESVLEDKRREESWEQLREESIWATLKGGSGILALEWDATRGQDTGAYTDAGRSVSTGDIYVCTLAVSEFVLQPGTRNAETGQWWIKATALPPEEVQSMYELPKKPAADAVPGTTPLQMKLLNERRGEVPVDLTLVLTYFERPNFLRPKGAVVTVVANEVVDNKPWPFPFKDHLNFAMMRETLVNGRALGSTVLNAARPVQTALNASWSAQIEHMKLAGNARLVLPQSSADLLDEFTDLPAEIVLVPDGTTMRPEWLSPPAMPQWWLEQPTRLAEEIDDILGYHQVSRGDAPPNIESGFGLSILAEQDATPLSRLSKEQAIAWAKIGTMVLKLYEKKATEKRTARVKSPGYPAETVKWSGKDLLGQTCVEVPLDAVLPRSRAAMMAYAEKMLQMNPTWFKTAADFAKLADIPDQRDIVETLHPDVAKARRENHVMSTGEISLPADYDDHNIHVQEHNTFRKSVTYEMLDQDTKNIVDTHIQGHATMSAEELGAQYDKGRHDPLLASAANPQGAPALSAAEGAQAQAMLDSGGAVGIPGGAPAPGAEEPVTSAFPEGAPAPPLEEM